MSIKKGVRMITELQILKYAYNGVLELWGREYDRLQANPDNAITKALYEKYDKDLDEIRARLIELEQ